MKKIILLTTLMTLATLGCQAQLGGLMNKALQKATQKLEQDASTAIKKELGLNADKKAPAPETDQQPTLPELLAQMPDMPTAEQLISHFAALEKNQMLKLATSPVTKYKSQIANIQMEATSLLAARIDTTRLAEAQYRIIQAQTGLSQEQLNALAQMSEEEQEAYLMAYYQSGQAQQAALKTAENMAEYLQPSETQRNRYDAIEDQVAAIHRAAQAQMAPFHQQFAAQRSQLQEAGNDAAVKELNIQYFTKVAAILRQSVADAAQLRLTKQYPLAEEIDQITRQALQGKPESAYLMLSQCQQFLISFFGEFTALTLLPEVSAE